LVWVLSATLALPVQAAVTITDVVHGGVVVHAPVTRADGRVVTEIAQSTARAIVHASDFNIAPNHIVNITQPVGGWMLARVFGPATRIDGALNATTGSFILLNPNGVFIGPTGQVSVGGMFAASTLNLSNSNFLNGMYLFQDSGTNGVIRNAGAINAGIEGVYLFAPNVENAATGIIITSTNGHVSLGAGSTAFLSNRPDGRGFLSQVTAPVGEALNLGQLFADGGQVTMAGRVVNQGNLVQANSVVQRNGRIELVASEQVTMRAGSRTTSAGGEAGAHGGTIIATAATRDVSGTRTGGSVQVESGATIDVTPGAGGVAGEVWLGGTTVSQNGTVLGTTHRRIPDRFDLSDAELLSLAPGVARGEINVLAMDDINVTTSLPLDVLGLPFGQAATFQLNAGRNLRFTSSDFKSFGGQWHIIGRAARDLTITASEISTASRGSIHLHAGGNLSLVDGSARPAKVNTGSGGGDVSLTAVEDVVIPGPFGTTSDDGQTLLGVHIGIPGNLTIRAGRDISGSGGSRDIRGPGFTLQGGTADVAAGRNIGSEQTPMSIVLGGMTQNADGTASVTRTEATIKAGGSLYFGLAEDYGLREFQTLTANSSLTLIARTGDILVKPGRLTGGYEQTRRIFPASFTAQADEGSVIFETGGNAISFWPSSTGAIRISARHDIRGQGQFETGPEQSVLIYVGNVGDPTAHYVRVNRLEALADPELSRWLSRYGDLSVISGVQSNPYPGNILPPIGLRDTPIVSVRSLSPAILRLNGGDIDGLRGTTFNTESELTGLLNPTTPLAAASTPTSQVSLTTELGDISRLQLEFLSYRFLKEVVLSAGRDIRGVFAKFLVPVLSSGNPAVQVHAKGMIDMRTETGFAGLVFIGRGTGEVRAGGDIDLANSTGIELKSVDGVRSTRFQGGLLDIGAGGNINMTESRITTVNGGSIFIHGADGVRIVDAAGRPIQGAVETRALLINQSGTTVLALLDQNGAAAPIQAYKTTLPVDQTNPSQALFTAQDVTNGQVELVWKPLFVEQTGQLFVIGGQRVHQGEQIVFNQKVVLVDRNPVRDANGTVMLVDGRPALVDGKLTLEIGGQRVSMISPVGGRVNVGGNSSNRGEQTGITTSRGGNIKILSTGDVNVNRSRVGTFDSGNILIKSTAGTINAGSGSKGERTIFLIDNGDGTSTTAVVPGSGIFTWERDDPDFSTLPFPKFNTPQMNALFARITKRRFLGRDASDLVAEFDRLTELRKVEYDRIFEEFIQAPFGPGSRPLQLGDISLIAARNIDVPQAGIRGRRINLEAGDALNLLGGSIIGKATFSASSVSGSLGAFAGAAAGSVGGASVSAAGGAGGGSVGGLSGATSTVSATSASTSTTSSTAAKAVEQVQQTTAESTGSSASNSGKQVASKDGEKDKKSQMAKSVQIKRGVVIQVDVKPQAQPGS
jgi:filamentous hemagglutinin family protein